LAKNRRLLTNFSKGELSPLVEGRPDLAAYFEGGSIIENFVLLRQGGLQRRFGTRFIKEVKDSSKDTILLPFEASVDDSYAIESGDLYKRFYKNKARIESPPGTPVEVVSPYTEARLRNIHFTQSVDQLFLFEPNTAQRKLSRISDTSWSLLATTFKPPASFEADTDISAGATLTPGATSGTNVTFTASAAVFQHADKGRLIIFGASRAVITLIGTSAGSPSPQATIKVDILDAFPNTNPIPSGSWFLRLSPQTTLDPTAKEPVGAQVTLVAGVAAFRAADVGKFVQIFEGLIKITAFDSATQVKGEIFSILSTSTSADPPAAPAGAWTLEEASWSATRGFPRTGEFYQGRLVQAATISQPTTFWLSKSDDFDNYAVGAVADNAIEYTVASRQLDRIEWLTDNEDLFLGTGGAELLASSGKTDAAWGGDVIPQVRSFGKEGCASIQPVVIGGSVIFIARNRKKIFQATFGWETSKFENLEITGIAEHITGTGVRLGAVAFQRRPDPRLYFIREDGTLVTLTYFPKEKVVGFTRIVTDGTFESVCVVSQSGTDPDSVYVIVKRVINGQTKRYVEVFEENGVTSRAWKELHTDCAVVYNGVSTLIIGGLTHLEGKTVDVVADGSFRGTKVVTGGQVILDEAASQVEIGLHYDSTVTTMRPAIEGVVVEGLPRAWDQIYTRLFATVGGRINNEWITYPPSPLDTLVPFTGDRQVSYQGWDTEGRITIKQTQPYPMTLLAIFGELSTGDHG
jgi:hypothetical protein